MMTLPQLQSFLLLGAALNYAILLLGFLAWVLIGDALCRLHARWFALDRAQIHQAAYLLFGAYKLAIWLFFIVPWLALYLLRQG